MIKAASDQRRLWVARQQQSLVLDLPHVRVHVTRCRRRFYWTDPAHIAQYPTLTHIPQHKCLQRCYLGELQFTISGDRLIIHWLAPWTLFWASLLVYSRITSTKQILGRHQLQNISWTRSCAGRLRNTRSTAHRDTQQGQVRTLIRIGRSYWPK